MIEVLLEIPEDTELPSAQRKINFSEKVNQNRDRTIEKCSGCVGHPSYVTQVKHHFHHFHTNSAYFPLKLVNLS